MWAPRPSTVALAPAGGRPCPLERDEGGWWWSSEAVVGEYRIVVDGEPLPDPRSPWQPAGVDGPSCTVDHAAFRWTDGSWRGRPLGGAVLYELHVGTFTPTGTFDAAIDRLDHLCDLGVDAVELMPVAEFPGRRGWGYDGVLLYAPHHAYGGPDGLKRLVDACHERGLAVVLDVVYNHLGPSGNHLGRFGPYFTDRHRTPWGDAMNLDGEDSDDVRRFLIDNAVGWIRDYHVDGLRLDAVHALVDQSATHVVEQLTAEVHDQARASGRQVWVIAESDLNDPRLVRSVDAGGLGVDAAWSDDFHHALHAAVTGERDGYYAGFGRVSALARSLTDVFVHDGRFSPHRRRHHGRPVGATRRDRFVGYSQNHDQVGNRARGERLVHLSGRGPARIAAALTLTAPFVPLLFQGEEWAASTPFLYFTDHSDAALGRAVAEGRRRELPATESEEVPDPQAEATFLSSQLKWSERVHAGHAEMLQWYRTLIALRAQWPELSAGSG